MEEKAAGKLLTPRRQFSYGGSEKRKSHRTLSWTLLLLLLRVTSCVNSYWGTGWEDPVSKSRLYKALPVTPDDVSAVANPDMELNDDFNWEAFESGGGTTRVRGLEGFEPQPLQSWVPRHDAVQHGYYMVYRMDDLVTTLNGSMADYFFSISMDVSVHPDYAADSAHGAHVNSSIRFSLYEGPPGGLDLSEPESNLWMVDYDANYQRTLQGGNSDDVDTRRHNLMWGLETNPSDGSLSGNCTRSVSALYIGVQCMAGFRFPASACTVDPNSPPTLSDCSAYCPFTLTVRAMPRRLEAGQSIQMLLAAGQWASFELHAGAYDLLDVTIDRAEFDNQTYPDQIWRDGFTGRAWLSRGTCIKGANLTIAYADGYCPQGGLLTVDPATQLDVPPHRFCSRELNYSYTLNIPQTAHYVRDATISDSHGELDDLGFYDTQVLIAKRRVALEESMHYPTQLEIRAEIARLERHLVAVGRGNSTWRRRWPMRLCTGANEAGTYVLTLYADVAMDAQAHSGSFLVRFTNQAFARTPLADRTPRTGCLRRGTSETFQLPTPTLQPQLTSLGQAQVLSYYVSTAENQVSSLTVRRGAAPTTADYDARVAHPARLRVAMSACDATAPQVWFFTVSLSATSSASEVFFSLAVDLEDSTRELGESISGLACCGQYKYYAFPAVDERVAPRVAFNLTSGTLKAVYWRYDACPVEEEHVRDGTCVGWCILDWYRIFSGNLGKPRFRYASVLQVPYGMGEAPDKRRGGTWYLGIQALQNAEARYSLTTAYEAPEQAQQLGCDRMDRYCQMPDRFKDVLEESAAAPRGSARGAAATTTTSALLAAAVAALHLLHRAHGGDHG